MEAGLKKLYKSAYTSYNFYVDDIMFFDLIIRIWLLIMQVLQSYSIYSRLFLVTLLIIIGLLSNSSFPSLESEKKDPLEYIAFLRSISSTSLEV